MAGNSNASKHESIDLTGVSDDEDEQKALLDILFPHVRLSEKDIRTLEPGTWVNDQVIKFYIEALKRVLRPGWENHIYFFSSFFLPKFSGDQADGKWRGWRGKNADLSEAALTEAYERVRKWTAREKVPLLHRDVLVFPLHHGDFHHWSAAVFVRPWAAVRAPSPVSPSFREFERDLGRLQKSHGAREPGWSSSDDEMSDDEREKERVGTSSSSTTNAHPFSVNSGKIFADRERERPLRVDGGGEGLSVHQEKFFVLFLDPLGSSDERLRFQSENVLKPACAFFEMELKHKHPEAWSRGYRLDKGFKAVSDAPVPQQQNSWDCGLFALRFISELALSFELSRLNKRQQELRVGRIGELRDGGSSASSSSSSIGGVANRRGGKGGGAAWGDRGGMRGVGDKRRGGAPLCELLEEFAFHPLGSEDRKRTEEAIKKAWKTSSPDVQSLRKNLWAHLLDAALSTGNFSGLTSKQPAEGQSAQAAAEGSTASTSLFPETPPFTAVARPSSASKRPRKKKKFLRTLKAILRQEDVQVPSPKFGAQMGRAHSIVDVDGDGSVESTDQEGGRRNGDPSSLGFWDVEKYRKTEERGSNSGTSISNPTPPPLAKPAASRPKTNPCTQVSARRPAPTPSGRSAYADLDGEGAIDDTPPPPARATRASASNETPTANFDFDFRTPGAGAPSSATESNRDFYSPDPPPSRDPSLPPSHHSASPTRTAIHSARPSPTRSPSIAPDNRRTPQPDTTPVASQGSRPSPPHPSKGQAHFFQNTISSILKGGMGGGRSQRESGGVNHKGQGRASNDAAGRNPRNPPIPPPPLPRLQSGSPRRQQQPAAVLPEVEPPSSMTPHADGYAGDTTVRSCHTSSSVVEIEDDSESEASPVAAPISNPMEMLKQMMHVPPEKAALPPPAFPPSSSGGAPHRRETETSAAERRDGAEFHSSSASSSACINPPPSVSRLPEENSLHSRPFTNLLTGSATATPPATAADETVAPPAVDPSSLPSSKSNLGRGNTQQRCFLPEQPRTDPTPAPSSSRNSLSEERQKAVETKTPVVPTPPPDPASNIRPHIGLPEPTPVLPPRTPVRLPEPTPVPSSSRTPIAEEKPKMIEATTPVQTNLPNGPPPSRGPMGLPENSSHRLPEARVCAPSRPPPSLPDCSRNVPASSSSSSSSFAESNHPSSRDVEYPSALPTVSPVSSVSPSSSAPGPPYVVRQEENAPNSTHTSAAATAPPPPPGFSPKRPPEKEFAPKAMGSPRGAAVDGKPEAATGHSTDAVAVQAKAEGARLKEKTGDTPCGGKKDAAVGGGGVSRRILSDIFRRQPQPPAVRKETKEQTPMQEDPVKQKEKEKESGHSEAQGGTRGSKGRSKKEKQRSKTAEASVTVHPTPEAQQQPQQTSSKKKRGEGSAGGEREKERRSTESNCEPTSTKVSEASPKDVHGHRAPSPPPQPQQPQQKTTSGGTQGRPSLTQLSQSSKSQAASVEVRQDEKEQETKTVSVWMRKGKGDASKEKEKEKVSTRGVTAGADEEENTRPRPHQQPRGGNAGQPRPQPQITPKANCSSSSTPHSSAAAAPSHKAPPVTVGKTVAADSFSHQNHTHAHTAAERGNGGLGRNAASTPASPAPTSKPTHTAPPREKSDCTKTETDTHPETPQARQQRPAGASRLFGSALFGLGRKSASAAVSGKQS
uniref:Ubiquitin-like protease family profile domain-containing protein n=1 Tax=Chromera velia CCMP2878 TaxID=1169474 RepID=A0A0G4HLF8_9ALVE|eukprot:Cvel_7326.t1-p1 / transcript=Cvel_7326.t1 / gene=Cvel_7326 / organism=Chromera_velia_CCMP2878 / gene_product=Probable ubiquitin-like-specific protease 2B, putative / transcript_product=Probable ubiquitin-like-specific protease 2B, putative / location=Cvel_scaffold380:17934-25943(+) / protein_length=1675 / sequence_SO=supercontig / SO=protein_coding / is_pseudo=false